MKRWLTGAAVAFAVGALAIVAVVASARPATGARVCVVIETIQSWNPVDQWTVVVGTADGQNYKVTFAGPCPHMKWSVLTRVEARASARRCLSSGDIMIFGRGGRRPDNTFLEETRCAVASVEAIATKPPLPPARPPF